MEKINNKKIRTYFFLGLFLGIGVLLFFVLKPFLIIIAIAIVLATILNPIYKWFVKFFGGGKRMAAFFVLALTLVLVIGPLVLISRQIYFETRAVYDYLQNSGVALPELPSMIQNNITAIFPNFNIDIQGYVDSFFNWLLNNMGRIFSGAVEVALGFVLTFISLFFFLKDGEEFKTWLIKLSPLDDKHDHSIFNRLRHTVFTVVVGTLAVALIQGILVGIGFLIFGIPNVMVWSLIAALSALIPGIGTALVTVPAILYLFFNGSVVAAIGLLIWSVVLVGLIDNLLVPYFYSRGDHAHPLLILFAVLGGLIYFGPAGFLLGPIVLSAFLALIQIYQTMFNSEKLAAAKQPKPKKIIFE